MPGAKEQGKFCIFLNSLKIQRAQNSLTSINNNDKHLCMIFTVYAAKCDHW
jgi:hypothetical protein